jgi:hypothetical protein
MTIYIVTNKQTGAEVYRYANDAPVEWSGMEFATHDHTAVVEINPDGSIEESATPVEMRVTKRSFWNRFPPVKETVMRAIMAQGSPALLVGGLQRLQVRVDSSPFVDLALMETRDGVSWLASAMVPLTIVIDGQTLPLRLTADEVAVILDTVPSEQEVYRGN